MKKLYDAVQRFCARYPRFGIPNLMLYIVAGNVIVYILMMFTQTNDANALAFLTLNTAAVLKGELWRIITYVFVPTSSGIFWLLISLYFYYWIGSTLERQWGTAKFTLYYISGVLLTAVGVLIASLISGQSYTVAGSYYVNLSMFFAFAFLFPDTQVLLFFIVPIKMKWLANLCKKWAICLKMVKAMRISITAILNLMTKISSRYIRALRSQCHPEFISGSQYL